MDEMLDSSLVEGLATADIIDAMTRMFDHAPTSATWCRQIQQRCCLGLRSPLASCRFEKI